MNSYIYCFRNIGDTWGYQAIRSVKHEAIVDHWMISKGTLGLMHIGMSYGQ